MSDSPAAILFDVNGNPVGTVIDGIFYRLQVEAKLAAGTNTVGKVDQGEPGVTPWPIDIQSPIGQKTMANSIPVVFASDQTINISSEDLSLGINDFEIPGFSTQISGSSDGYVKVIEVDGYGRQVVVGAGTAGDPTGGVVSVQGVQNGEPLPIIGEVTGTFTAGALSGTVTSNQGLQALHPNRWPVGISDGSAFVGTQASPLKVGDDFSGGEVLAQQNGAAAVLTFTFSAPVYTSFVEVVGSGIVCRVDPFGGTPSISLGMICTNDEKLKIDVITSSVKVYAPVGATVNVYGFRR